MKVYCSECFYFREDTEDCFYRLNCAYTDTPIRRIESYAEKPEKLNANNDCKKYINKSHFRVYGYEYRKNADGDLVFKPYTPPKEQPKPGFWRRAWERIKKP